MRKIALLLFVMNLTFLFAENWTYELETITLPTRNAENEIYVYDVPVDRSDVFDEGPSKFQIDNTGNIYILDGKKIKKFDSEGDIICFTQEQDLIIHSFTVHDNMIFAICGDHQNNVYLRRFDINCQLIDTHQIENRKSTLSINQNGKV